VVPIASGTQPITVQLELVYWSLQPALISTYTETKVQ
jgi:hypothetical protein